MPEFTKLLKAKSIIRYLPPKGTEGFVLSEVKGNSLSPFPPAKTNAKILLLGTINVPYSFISPAIAKERFVAHGPISSKTTVLAIVMVKIVSPQIPPMACLAIKAQAKATPA